MSKKSGDEEPCPKSRFVSRLIDNSSRITNELNRRLLKDFAISIAKYEVLQAIKNCKADENTMSNLSTKLNVSNANITGMINRLRLDGLVVKKPTVSDRRIYCVTLTNDGENLLTRAREKRAEWVQQLMGNVKFEDVDLINYVFDKLDQQTENFISKN